MRIFVAVPLPDRVKKSLHGLCQTAIPGVRWEHPADFHITLRFIGDIDEAHYHRYLAALRTIQTGTFSISLAGTGRFPPLSSRSVRILWAGIRASPDLQQLYCRISSVLEVQGLTKDKFEDYSPHITLGRCTPTALRDSIDQFLMETSAFRTEPIHVESFVMYQTTHNLGAGKYHPLATFPLRD